MRIERTSEFDQIRVIVLIGNEQNRPAHLTASEEVLFERFLKGGEDFAEWTDFETKKMFIRMVDHAEKMRLLGAKVRGSMEKSVTHIGVKSNGRQTVPFLEGVLLANYQFLKYFKNKEDRENRLNRIVVDASIGEEQVIELLNTYNAVRWMRDMVNEPVSYLNAEQFSKEIYMLSERTELTVSILEKSQMEALKMGGILAVNQGSLDHPTFTIVEYKPKSAKNHRPVVLVGKGVVYDTGGLSLKSTANSMDIMKSDMAGGACVAGAIYLAALQELPVHVIALIPATDNRPGLNAFAPGDVVQMFNGSTVEVLNTDAEGRMILADALTYSTKYDPELVVEASTLTGSAVSAIGEHASIVMGNADNRYFDQLESAGKVSHERVVRFPFWDDYDDEIKSSIADLKNIGGPTAGMITAGKFLEHFVNAPYIHMDIAGPTWKSKGSGYCPSGASGFGVRLLYQFLKNYA